MESRDLPFLGSTEFLKAILSHFQGFIAVVGEDYRVLFANRALVERTGYDPVGHLCHRSFHGLESPCPNCPLARVVERGETVSMEKMSPFDERWYSMVACPLLLPSGKRAMLVVVMDVHEKRTAQERAARHHAFLETILDRIPMGIIGLKRGGEIVYVNRAFTEILGYEADEILGRRVLEFIAPEDLAAAQNCCREVFSQESLCRTEFSWLRKDGDKRLLQSTCFLVKTPEGEDLVFNISLDITEQRLLQEQFLQAQKMEAVGRLAGGIAHDFNNLLTSLRGYLQLIHLHQGDRERVSEAVVNMERAIDRAAELTQQLLTFSRRRPERRKEIELGRFFGEMRDFLRRLLGENIRLEVEVPETPLYIQADEGHLQQVIMNLAVNARDAMPGGGVLRIELGEALPEDFHCESFLPSDRRYAVISVSDTGTGIPQDVLPHIFDPFFTTKPPGEGTGLGLATVYSIVKQYSGHIFVETREGQGTRFIILWPTVEPSARAAEDRRRQIVPKGHETILFVEDDPLVREPVAELLRNLGYRVIEAGDGQEALRLAEENRGIDLVITDLVMPRMGGEELALELKRRFPEVKILLSSGYPKTGVPVNESLSGMAFISKPYRLQELAQKVRELLDA